MDKLLSAANTIDKAMTDSTQRLGSETTFNVAQVKVIECASVKAVTTFKISKNGALKWVDACHLLFL
jgi:hypothetical protein